MMGTGHGRWDYGLGRGKYQHEMRDTGDVQVDGGPHWIEGFENGYVAIRRQDARVSNK